MSEYIYDPSWSEERARLVALESVLDPGTIRVLEELGVGEGWRCLEVGAGAGSIVRWLCDRVGSSGHLVATDLDTRFLAEIDAPNLEVRTHDIVREPIEREAFDLVHSRDVLEHIPEREAVLDTMVAALRPGGWLVIEDVDFATALRGGEGFGELSDATALLAKMWNSSVSSMHERGVDAEYGRRLPWRLRAHGLEAVGGEVRGSLVTAGTQGRDLMLLSLTTLRPMLIQLGALTPEEADQLLDAVKAPDFMDFAPFHVAAWGRKPA
jgi:SAM-dependent methyltransferase